MFHGGTNFGFYNGASTKPELPDYASVTTSYDYDALLTENGDYTEKYELVRGILMDFHEKEGRPATLFGSRPEPHPASSLTEFPALEASEAVSLFDVLVDLTRALRVGRGGALICLRSGRSGTTNPHSTLARRR